MHNGWKYRRGPRLKAFFWRRVLNLGLESGMGSLFLGFDAFLSTNFLKIFLEKSCFYPPSSSTNPHPHPLCAYLQTIKNWFWNSMNKYIKNCIWNSMKNILKIVSEIHLILLFDVNDAQGAVLTPGWWGLYLSGRHCPLFGFARFSAHFNSFLLSIQDLGFFN